jgi:hypothetical protein
MAVTYVYDIEPSGSNQLRESTRSKHLGPALLNCHRMLGPLSPVPLILVGNSDRTSYYNRQILINSCILIETQCINNNTIRRKIVKNNKTVPVLNDNNKSLQSKKNREL